jgi:putative transposase
MPTRKTPLITDHYYHVYNRGVGGQPIFTDTREYQRFLLTLRYYRCQKTPIQLSRFLEQAKEKRAIDLSILERNENVRVEILAYVLMPNHFHLLMKQSITDGIKELQHQLWDSYGRFFNLRHERSGTLWQGRFKAKLLETDEQLMHVSRYIHINPLVAGLVDTKNLFSYPWSSLSSYFSEKISFVNTKIILGYFPNILVYKSFILDQIDYAHELEKIKHLIFD